MLKKMDGASLVVPNLGFKKYVSRFLEDCPDVSTKVSEGQLGKKNLSQLIHEYNECIDQRTPDHGALIARQGQQNKKISAWVALEEKVKSKEFGDKNNALEMIAEIRKKIQREETIPNFLLEGLRNSLEGTGLSQELGQAIEEIR